MAWAEKHKGAWRGRYRAPDGTIRTAGKASTAKKAKELAQDKESEIRNGRWFDPDAGKVTFGDYYEKQWRPTKHAELNTMTTYDTTYRSSLRAEFGEVELRHILPSTVQGWVTRQVKEGVNPATVVKRFRCFQTIIAGRKGISAMRDGLIAKNPCTGTELPTIPEREVTVYRKEHVQQLVKTIDPWWRPLIILAAETGMRWGELQGLKVSDFSLGMKKVVVQRTIVETTRKASGGHRYVWKPYPKGKRSRILALNPGVAKMITQVIAARGLGADDKLFSMPDLRRQLASDPVPVDAMPLRTEEWPGGIPIERGYFRTYVWLKAIEEAELPPLRFHDLRASNISWLLRGGLDIAQVRERAGHQHITTTQKYIKALDVDEDALAALSDLWGDGVMTG